VFIVTRPARVTGFACRPLAQMTQADLAAITEELRSPAWPDGRPFRELLRAYS
jgi:hypothetical protein